MDAMKIRNMSVITAYPADAAVSVALLCYIFAHLHATNVILKKIT